ncbi:MAG TPA: S-layer homology domain-containing protein, partial [Anaerovoracaceae bacterium]|nr:S-layer homology domain-containing protein [Anaerovoracaceae bacterium]
SDINGNVYENAITTLVDKGIITGDVDGQFHPDSRLTRAQACIMVVKAMNPPDSEVTGTPTQVMQSAFPDMAGYGWVEGYIAYAVNKGIVKGYPDGTFKPGNLVNMEELTTMVIRASGYTDALIGGKYPSNYMEKGTSLGLFNDMVMIMIYPTQVTKAMTAKIIFNGLTMIENANPQTPVENNNGETPSAVPNLVGKTYLAGDFNSTMTEFAGKAIASDVKVYTYGKEIDYKSTMTLTNNISDFRIDTVYKYKNVNTPIWYAMTGDKISEIILPMDVGFSGYAYGVINGTVMTLNAKGDAVTGVATLVAGRPIMWLGTTGMTDVPESDSYLDGEVYEINLRDGQARTIAASTSGRAIFVELTTSGGALVYANDNGVVRLGSTDGGLFAIKDNAAVYVLSDDQTEYTAGSLSDIRKDRAVRLYDRTDDDDNSADIVVVSKTL